MIIRVAFVFCASLFGYIGIAQTAVSALKQADLMSAQHPDSINLMDSVIEYANTLQGCSYGFGSCGPSNFDCSGFVMHVFGKFDVVLPHGSASQESVCDEIKLKNVRPGDLLFFAGRKISSKNIGHVAIVSNVNEGKITMIHSTVQAGVLVEVLDESEYFAKRFIKAGRIRVSAAAAKL